MSPVLAAALEFGRNGWPVYPIVAGGRASHRSKKDNGQRWGCTKDPIAIRNDFTKWPEAGVGIVTGSWSDLAVVDIDRKNGRDGFAWLEAQGNKLPATLSASTPHDGRHDYFLLNGAKVRSCDLAPGVELKAENRSITAPPTSGYKWLNHGPIAQLPQWIIDLANRPAPSTAMSSTVRPIRNGNGSTAYGVAALESEIAALCCAPPGHRNAALNYCAFRLFQLVPHELDGDEVERRLYQAVAINGARDCKAKIKSTIESGKAAGLTTPRFPRPR